jgi:hypothetical protein
MLTGKQVSAKLGVSRTTLGRLRAPRRIEARICNDKGEWLYSLPLPPESPATPVTPSNDSLGASAAGGAA